MYYPCTSEEDFFSFFPLEKGLFTSDVGKSTLLRILGIQHQHKDGGPKIYSQLQGIDQLLHTRDRITWKFYALNQVIKEVNHS